MSFTDGKSFIVTDEQAKLHWSGGFNCKLCGKMFVGGSEVRWIYANGTKDAKCCNFFVCKGCDTGDNEKLIMLASISFVHACELAKRWDIYGPDWVKDRP